jgi:hypothetical protein
MVPLLQITARIKRLRQLFRDVHEQTGSFSSAAIYTGRLVARKIPVAVRRVRHSPQHKAVISDVQTARSRLEARTPFLAIRVSGGLGDCLVIARFLRDLSAYTGGIVFDIYASDPERARWAFGAVDGLRACHDDLLFDYTHATYDLALRISQFVVVHKGLTQWSRLRAHPRLLHAVTNIIRYRPKIEAFIERHPFLDGFLAQKAIYANQTRATFLHHMAGLTYGGDRLDVATVGLEQQKHDLEPGRYITVHNGFDPDFVIMNQRATKCYPHFGTVVGLLKKRWPDLKFVQIGVSTSEPLAEVDLNLINRTSMREAAGLIAGALLHIDNEGGLVHLARCLGVASCVVFGPTPSAYFGYSGNVNVDPTFCGGCWWINETWMNQCPRGFATPRCMTEQDPLAVAAAIHRHLTARQCEEALPPVTLDA